VRCGSKVAILSGDDNESLTAYGRRIRLLRFISLYYITYMLGPWAIVVDLAYRCYEYEIYKGTGRPVAFGELRCSSVWGPTVVCLALLLTLRMGMSMVVSVELFLAFHSLRSDQANLVYPEP
jgi:hypothetical protein